MEQRHFTIQADRDLMELKKMLMQYIQKTYVTQIEKEMYRCRQTCQNKSSREIELLSAFIPYIPEEKKHLCQELIQLLEYEQVIKEMLPMFRNERGGELTRGQKQIQEGIVKVLLYYMIYQMDQK